MDLKELNDVNIRRHPWETARLKAVQRILAPFSCEKIKVLDVGCGDGFVSRGLFSKLQEKEITAIDMHFSDEMIQRLAGSDNIRYRRELPDEGFFDLILLLDVLEHVADDREFLANLVSKHLSPGGKMLITVPAFQSLYSCHDTFLGHFRRYRLPGLVAVATASRLTTISSGYLFLTLLLPKLVLFKFLDAGKGSDGVGRWRRGRIVTKFCEFMLTIDNSILLAASRIGIRLPGLTGWVLCEKQK